MCVIQILLSAFVSSNEEYLNDKIMLSLVHSEDELFHCGIAIIRWRIKSFHTISRGLLVVSLIYYETVDTFNGSRHSSKTMTGIKKSVHARRS